MSNKIVGQKKLLQSQYEAIMQDQFSHATLLYSKSGYGVLPIALELAEFLVCQNRSTAGPCGQCPSCHKSQQWIHPDIHFAFPVVKKGNAERVKITSKDFLSEWRKALDANPYMSLAEWVSDIVTSSARADINVTECNQISHQLTLQAFGGGAKVQIIWMADLLGNNGNRLLKLIEEPPENTYIILTAEDTDSVLNTIKSRCRLLAVPRIDEASVRDYLEGAYHVDVEKASQIAFLCEGDFSDALSYVDVDSGQLLQIALLLFAVTRAKDIVGIRDWVDEFNGYNSQEQRGILHYILKLLREMLHYHYLGEAGIRLGREEVHMLQERGVIAEMTLERIKRLSDILSDALTGLARNANTKVLMYNTCLEIESVIHSEAILTR